MFGHERIRQAIDQGQRNGEPSWPGAPAHGGPLVGHPNPRAMLPTIPRTGQRGRGPRALGGVAPAPSAKLEETRMKRFKNILFVAGPEEGAAALHRAAALARENQALLTVTSVVEALPGGVVAPGTDLTGEGLQSALVAEAQRRLDRLVAPWRDGVEIQTQVLAGTLFLEVVRDVLRNGRDLVVKPIADPGPLGLAAHRGGHAPAAQVPLSGLAPEARRPGPVPLHPGRG